MAKDPVCGMQVNEQQAAGKSEYHGETYYFCSTMGYGDFYPLGLGGRWRRWRR